MGLILTRMILNCGCGSSCKCGDSCSCEKNYNKECDNCSCGSNCNF
uniref:Putative metallothionein-like protein 1B n=1 Tax=Arabidopsis thaliana TaxID=3702 RepID=MT1B_ARATH|nr:PUTATIVE PSEUDOGENE: RecName: Full=Putative metallothionein-like protein 1B; Short=MT-1B [Arabidopsis thaliana]AAA82210.1 metallothionein [Arabidopsis thaliana]